MSRPPDGATLEALGDVTVVLVADGLRGPRRPRRGLAAPVRAARRRDHGEHRQDVHQGGRRRRSSAGRFTTLRSEGNQNNEIGLPLTLLRLGPEHEAAVLEMGMYIGGEIADLAAMAAPRIGVVTAVQPVHLSRIGHDRRDRARRRRELVEALPPDGTAVLNADDARVARMAASTAARVVTYGFDPVPMSGPRPSPRPAPAGMRFTLRAAGPPSRSRSRVLGRHGVHNGLAAAAVGLAAGMHPRRDRGRARGRLVGARTATALVTPAT